jgi:hypothetical protein
MAGLLYSKPENPVLYLRECLDKLLTGGVQSKDISSKYPWDLFLGERRSQRPPSRVRSGKASHTLPTKAVLPPIGGSTNSNSSISSVPGKQRSSRELDESEELELEEQAAAVAAAVGSRAPSAVNRYAAGG